MKLVAREVLTVAAVEATKVLLSSGELIPIVGSFARLLSLGIVACETAKCNRDAFKQLKYRLCTIANLFLGDSGLMRVAKEREQNDILQNYVIELENILEEGLKYLNAFTKVGFLSNLMGTRHLQKFNQLDSDMTSTIQKLTVSLQMTLILEQSATYDVVVNIQAKIDGQYGGLKNVYANEKLLHALANDIQADVSDLRAEIQDSLDRIEETVNQVDENVRVIKDAMLGFESLKCEIKSIIEMKQDQLQVTSKAYDLIPTVKVKDTPVIDRSQILGQGSFGVVYAAEYLQEQVAVKIITTPQSVGISNSSSTTLMRELHKEVLMHSKVCHLPGVVKLYGANLSTEPRYVILERATCSLYDAVHLRQPQVDLSLYSKIGLLTQIAAALDYIHQLNLIHRDIKSSNILLFLQDRGRVIAKLSDFGLAKTNTDNTFVLNKSPKGSPPYMSPEAFQGCYSYGTDIYSLAVMMNELMLEERPFAELNTPHEIWLAVLDGKRPAAYVAETADLVGCRLESLIGIGWSNDEALRPNSHKVHKELMDLLKLSAQQAKCGVSSTQVNVDLKSPQSRGVPATADNAIRALNQWLTTKCGLLPVDSMAIARSLVNIKRITSFKSLENELCIDPFMLSHELGVPRAYETKIKDTLKSDFKKPLESLTVDDVAHLLESLHMSRYADLIRTNDITGLVLSSIECVDELLDLGIESKAHGKALLSQIDVWQKEGVSIDLLKASFNKVRLNGLGLLAYYRDRWLSRLCIS